jgi:hypothetical protein
VRGIDFSCDTVFRFGTYPFLRQRPLRVPPLRRVTFSKRRKGNPKGLLLRTARSLRLGVPSLRDRSGRSAYGLLRCTSSRCVWLRQTVAALPPPDQSLHSAFRRRLWIKIKSRRADTRSIEWLRAKRCSAVNLCCDCPHTSPLPREREPICGLFKA